MIDYRKWDEEGWIRRCQSQHQWEGTAPQRIWRQAFMTQYRDRILLEAALLSIQDHERYVALREEDVVTRCKRCAFLEDLSFLDSYSQGVHAERQRREVDKS